MLHIILIILKIIGIVLFTILGILLLVTGIVLYTPFKYQAEASLKGTLESATADIKFSWLFHLVRGNIQYISQKLEWQVWIFWKKFSNAVVDQKELIEKSEKAMEESSENVVNETETKEISVEDNLEKTYESKSKQPESKQSKSKKRLQKRKKEKLTDKIKSTFCNICDKIKTIREKKETLEAFISDEVHIAAFTKTKNELFRFLKKLKPKKFHLKLHFGFEDPSITGKVLGLLCMLYPIFEDNIEMKPDFQNTVLEGNVFIKGKLRGALPVGMVLRLVIDKNVRHTFIEVVSGKKTKKRKTKQKAKM